MVNIIEAVNKISSGLLSESITARLKLQYVTVFELLSAVETETVGSSLNGKWSVKDNIAHLARYQEIFLERINIILENNNPKFDRYAADADVEFEKWRVLELPEILSRLESDRNEIIKLLIALPKSKLSRIGIHPKYGEMDIAEWTEFFLLHEAHHIYTMFQSLKSQSQ